MLAGYALLLFYHLNNQNYYSRNLNNFCSSIWTSITLQSFVYIIFTLAKIKPYFPIFFGILVVGMIIGWFLNKIYYNQYCKKIFNNIKRKFNKHHIIEKIKEKQEFDNQDEVEKSLETIGNIFIIFCLKYL